ncbi:sulfotransferase family 2 domain-containing protein [Thiocystis violacea]|uniref:sulfotransferase family 2 domain-containing protein n=1 Tax=Thiocystis violacea TaxID=13725 RepID=UPI0019065DF5|nr:sulfotransferase family 2 domain-containing protein [Thiocystis violacea]MBK1720332.1 hypothetical protein [Thiocystis violacea]
MFLSNLKIRDIRKSLYSLENSNDVLAHALLNTALLSYCALDLIILHRASKPDTFSEKLFSADKSFLCVVIPKSGSRTLVYGLTEASQCYNFSLDISEKRIEHFVGEYYEYFKFSVVRNPWARCYSCYKQKIRNPTPIQRALHFNGRKGLRSNMSFGEFVEWLGTPEGSDERADRHWISQSIVLGLDKGMQYDYIGKLEEMDSVIRVVSERIGVSSDFFEHKLKSTEPDEYLKHCTPDIIYAIGERYAADIRNFGYDVPRID